MKLSQLLKGRRARKAVELQFGETTVQVDVRVLGPDEDIDISAAALAFAKSKGVADPAPGDDIYDKAHRAETLARACVDHDSPEDSPSPFFANVDEVLTSPLMTRDVIAFLIESQERWQDECSPRRRELSTAEYIKVVTSIAAGDMSAFFLLAPGAAVSCTRFMAHQLISSQTPSVLSSSPLPTT